MKEISVWLVVVMHVKAELSFAKIMIGALYVMMAGIGLTLWWSADN